MIDIEFGIWMSENLELALQVRADLDAAGELLPEDTHENIVINAASRSFRAGSFLDQSVRVGTAQPT